MNQIRNADPDVVCRYGSLHPRANHQLTYLSLTDDLSKVHHQCRCRRHFRRTFVELRDEALLIGSEAHFVFLQQLRAAPDLSFVVDSVLRVQYAAPMAQMGGQSFAPSLQIFPDGVVSAGKTAHAVFAP